MTESGALHVAQTALVLAREVPPNISLRKAPEEVGLAHAIQTLEHATKRVELIFSLPH